MPKPIRAEIHMSIKQSQLMGTITLELSTCVQDVDVEPQRSFFTVGGDQVFLRIQEPLNNQLRRMCQKIEDILKKQRKQQQ